MQWYARRAARYGRCFDFDLKLRALVLSFQEDEGRREEYPVFGVY